MRRSIFKRVAVALLVIVTILPASAATPQRAESGPGFLDRIILIIKHITAMDDARPNLPVPGSSTTTTT